jgi:hypothetical protein
MGPTALLPFRKEGVLRIFFFALKNPDGRVWTPWTLGSKGQHATSRPLKQLLWSFIKTHYEKFCCCFLYQKSFAIWLQSTASPAALTGNYNAISEPWLLVMTSSITSSWKCFQSEHRSTWLRYISSFFSSLLNDLCASCGLRNKKHKNYIASANHGAGNYIQYVT